MPKIRKPIAKPIKRTSISINQYNKEIDTKPFNGTHYKCISAGQVAAGKFKGSNKFYQTNS